MSVSCNTFPTLTSTDVITTESISTSTSTSVTTSPPTVITSTTVLPCTGGLGITSTCIPTTSTTLITHSGEVVTTEVPITVSVDIISTRLATLFGTSCTTINKPVDPAPPPYTPPPPVITNISSSTQPNGIITVVTKTETSTQTPDQQTSVQPPNQTDDQTNLAPIIGGVVGGFFGLIAIVALIWFILKRRRRWDDIFEKEDDDIVPPVGPSRGRHGRFSLDVDVEPKPYQYGLVGHATAPGPVSPPNSPPRPASIPIGTESQTSHHGRHQLSLTPLNLPTTVSSPGLSATTISSRPSTGGSTYPLRPPSQQGYFPAQTSQPQPRPVDFGRAATSTTNHSHTQSNASYTSPSMYSGTTHAIGMSMVGSSEDHPYTNRSGSPTSLQEQRILQVANAATLSPQSDTFQFTDSLVSSSSAPVVVGAATSAMPQRDGKGRLRTSTGKAPLVHLDGGRVQQELEEGSSSGVRPPGAAPPAYEA